MKNRLLDLLARAVVAVAVLVVAGVFVALCVTVPGIAVPVAASAGVIWFACAVAWALDRLGIM